MTALHLRESINRSPLRCAFVLTTLVLLCFGLSPIARAATPDIVPAPDGCYPGFNTAEGCQALLNINTAQGLANSAFGQSALRALTSGDNNTAVGVNSLLSLTTGIQNTGLGQGALQTNNGDQNTAIGFQALISNTTADGNTAAGFQALGNNTTGGTPVLGADPPQGPNTAIGSDALLSNTTGSNNNAVGFFALFSNNGVPPQGSFNNAHGNFALFSNTTGRQNNAFGDETLVDNVTGSFNTAIGDFAGSAITGNWNIDIGKDVFGIAGENFVTRIGISNPMDTHVQQKCFIGGVTGVNQGSPAAVFINTTTGQLGTTPPASSLRFKHDIKPMDETSDAILALKPVTFHYKSDNKNTPQFGLIAEQVAKVNPDLVLRDEKGEIYSVRYDAVNAMLLNEFLKARRQIDAQQKQIEALTATVQKVSAQLELNKPAPRTVNNQ